MRTEQEMMGLILGTARADDRIRAVLLEGSRTNPHASRDLFQDYDVAYVVDRTEPFYEQEGWIDVFGPRLLLQCPERMDALRGLPCDWTACYGWLMLLEDGNRIDLHVQTWEYTLAHILEDSLRQVLLDKDRHLRPLPPPSDRTYWVARPTPGAYRSHCNNFWWCLGNVAKGLWRGETPYVMDMLNVHLRPILVDMLSWKVGMERNFAVSVGKSGKALARYLPEAAWQRLLQTYPDSQTGHIWQAVFVLCDLFSEMAQEVAAGMQFAYRADEEAAARRYLEAVLRLPPDAVEICL